VRREGEGEGGKKRPPLFFSLSCSFSKGGREGCKKSTDVKKEEKKKKKKQRGARATGKTFEREEIRSGGKRRGRSL